jgi:ABC-type transport system involved in multi-copper enzyme maturation permease subunit
LIVSEASIDVDKPTSLSTNTVAARALSWIDQKCERIGDAVNPILVKEARQALKSRQFIFTFSALLFAALAWTIVGSLSMMPQIYTSPSAPRLLTGYYFVLAVPMLLVVPMAAYRSLEGEIEDGTLELLSISALGPWQIVLGKLASAMLQMALYYVVLFPCVAYAYNLRGVDLPTTIMIMGILFVSGVMLTIASLFMAAISSSRTGRITSLFVVVAMLFIAQWILGSTVVNLISYGNPLVGGPLVFAVTATISLSVALGGLMVTATAAQLTPESENRSSKIRLAMLGIGAVVIGLDALAIQTLQRDAFGWAMLCSYLVFTLWTVAGSMMAAESSIQTPRIRRELPQSFLARCTLTWLTPGPATGLVFAVINIVALTAIICVGLQLAKAYATWGLSMDTLATLAQWRFGAAAAYLVGFLVVVRAVVALIRIKTHPRAEIGLVVLIAIAILFALVPYSIQLHLNDYRDFGYSSVQATNWLWTLREIGDGNVSTYVVTLIGCLSSLGFMVCLLWASQLVLPRRTATPDRVLLEKQA